MSPYLTAPDWHKDDFNPRSVELNNQASKIIEGITYKAQVVEENENEYYAALELLDESIRLDSSYYVAYGSKIEILVRLKKYDQAVIVNERQLAHRPDYAEGYFFLGLLLDNNMDSLKANESYKKAIHFYKKRISRKEKVELNEINLALAYIFIGEEEKANKIYEKYLSDEKYGEGAGLIRRWTREEYLREVFN